MPSPARLFWTTLPFLLTLSSLIILLLVFLNWLSTSSSNPLNNLYLLSINTTSFTYAPQLNTSAWYTIGLWNYCSGPSNHSFSNPTFCSPRQAFFHFDPIEAWGLNSTLVAGTNLTSLGESTLSDGLEEYATVSRWMHGLFIAAVAATGVTFLLSFAGCASRCGSVFTSFAAGIAAVLQVAAAALATAVFLVLKAYVYDKLSAYNVTGDLGRSMFVLMWVGVGLSVLASVVWLFTICCCGGGDRKRKYERVESPRPQSQPMMSV